MNTVLILDCLTYNQSQAYHQVIPIGQTSNPDLISKFESLDLKPEYCQLTLPNENANTHIYYDPQTVDYSLGSSPENWTKDNEYTRVIPNKLYTTENPLLTKLNEFM